MGANRGVSLCLEEGISLILDVKFDTEIFEYFEFDDLLILCTRFDTRSLDFSFFFFNCSSLCPANGALIWFFRTSVTKMDGDLLAVDTCGFAGPAVFFFGFDTEDSILELVLGLLHSQQTPVPPFCPSGAPSESNIYQQEEMDPEWGSKQTCMCEGRESVYEFPNWAAIEGRRGW